MLAGLVSFSPTGFTHSGSGPAANQTSESIVPPFFFTQQLRLQNRRKPKSHWLCWMDCVRALSTPFNFLFFAAGFFAVFAAVAGSFIGAKAGESGDGPILERRTVEPMEMIHANIASQYLSDRLRGTFGVLHAVGGVLKGNVDRR
ncbi:hypothetical protein B0O80DRAFT_487765 [Mortierella sp. GBAus27b]|nr:hypothetical protein B0O80DRAFT_487765 [Mortierella sp. GBAus27b]